MLDLLEIRLRLRERNKAARGIEPEDGIRRDARLRSVAADLIAIAFVRRTLMELGYQLNPDAMSRQADVGALEMWVHESRPELGGATPLAVLKSEAGPARIREVLKELLEAGTGP